MGKRVKLDLHLDLSDPRALLAYQLFKERGASALYEKILSAFSLEKSSRENDHLVQVVQGLSQALSKITLELVQAKLNVNINANIGNIPSVGIVPNITHTAETYQDKACSDREENTETKGEGTSWLESAKDTFCS